ncbi:MAG: protein kinase, partial [Acidobacteriota bacterium]
MTEIGGTVSHYKILERLGEGGMGVVYRAEDTNLGRQVAVKVLPDLFSGDPERLARFEREARLLASLNHLNIATIHGLEQAEGKRFLVMELVEGATLAQRLLKGPLPLDEALEVCRQITEGVEAAHEKGVIHRDLKPANIKITPEGKVKILDFGLAKAFQEETAATDLSHSPTLTAAMTRAGVILGTAAYMSPEQAKGKPVDKRTDIWAFGCVLYECLTGKRAFEAETVTETIAAVLTRDPEWTNLAATLPDRVHELLRRCLQRDAFRRLRDIGDARIEIERAPFASSESGEAPSPHRGRGIGYAIAGLSLVLAGILVGYWLNPQGDAPATAWIGERLGGPTVAIWPRISPDGQTLAFQALIDGQAQLAVMRPQSGDWTLLTRDRSEFDGDMSWSTDGTRIYFAHAFVSRIFSIPAVGGEARLVLDNARTANALPDGSLLATRMNPDRRGQIYRFWPDSNRLQPLPAWPRLSLYPAVRVFPDGREAVFLGRPLETADAGDGIYAIDTNSGSTRRIAPAAPIHDDWNFPLAVTPDGDWVLFDIVGGNLHRIVAAPRDGSDRLRQIITLTSFPRAIDVGPDGSLYVDQMEGHVEILRLAAGAASPERWPVGSFFNGTSLATLPDGRLLLSARTGGRDRLYVTRPGMDPLPFVQTQEETRPPFCLVGRETVAFRIGRSTATKLALASSSDGRIKRQLSDVRADTIVSLAGSPDGKTIYYVDGGTVWAIPTDGGAPQEVCAGDAVAVGPAGEYLVVSRIQPEGVQLVRVSLPEGQGEILLVASDFRMHWGLSPGAIAKDGRIAVKGTASDSWYWQIRILDPRTGKLEKV